MLKHHSLTIGAALKALLPSREAPDHPRVRDEVGRDWPSSPVSRPTLSLAARLQTGRFHRLWTAVGTSAAFIEGWIVIGDGQLMFGHGLLIVALGLFIWASVAVVLVARAEAEQEAEAVEAAAQHQRAEAFIAEQIARVFPEEAEARAA